MSGHGLSCAISPVTIVNSLLARDQNPRHIKAGVITNQVSQDGVLISAITTTIPVVMQDLLVSPANAFNRREVAPEVTMLKR